MKDIEYDTYKENQRYTVSLYPNGESAIDFDKRMDFEDTCRNMNIKIEKCVRIGALSFMYRIFINTREQYDAIINLPQISSMRYSAYAVLDEMLR